MEEAEHALWRSAGIWFTRPTAASDGLGSATSFEYHRALRFEQEFDVTIRVTGINRRTITFASAIRRGDEPIATGRSSRVRAAGAERDNEIHGHSAGHRGAPSTRIEESDRPSRRRRHRRRTGGIHGLDAARAAGPARRAVRARALSALSHRRVADPGNLLGAEAAEHAAEDAGRATSSRSTACSSSTPAASCRRRSTSGTTSRTSARRPGRSSAASSTR